MEELIAQYGYVAIALGTFLEGEAILVLGGFSAHRGYLQLPWVIVCAFLGSFLGDQLYFHLGRTKGDQMLNKRPQWKAKSAKVLALLSKHQVWLILGFRFAYGLRTVTPFLIGAAGISPGRFFVLNLVGASVWAVVVASLGYFFGYAMEAFLGDLKRYELALFALLAAAGLVFWLGHVIVARRATH